MRCATLLTIVAAALPVRWAAASPLDVNPVRVDLGADQPSTVVTVRNPGDAETSYQLKARAWGQSPAGEMELADTGDIVFFPRLLTLAPGASRKIRVGLAPGVAASSRERSYRLFIEELPAARTAAKPGMSVLVTVGLPVFLAPVHAVAGAEVAGLAVERGRVAFALRATGSVHFVAGEVKVVGLDGAGGRVFERAQRGSYVLAGGERRYSIDLAAGECGAARSLRVDATTDDGRRLRGEIPLVPEACAP
jgi:fimbrial chaperone protein